MDLKGRHGMRVGVIVAAVTCLLMLLTVAQSAWARERLTPDSCTWIKQVWINGVGPTLVTTPQSFGVVVSDTVHIRDQLWCDFDYEWFLDESWNPDVLSTSPDPVSGDGDLNWDAGWLDWWGYSSASTSVVLDKYLHVDEVGWVTTEISETVEFFKGGPPFKFEERPIYLEELVEGGDAPSSHNHSTGITMTTHLTGVQANFPVVWDWDGTLGAGAGGGAYPSGYYGLCHYSSTDPSFLGTAPSYELDADLTPDQDPSANINPPSNSPDHDLSDDGVSFPTALRHCGSATVQITGHNDPGGTLYLNLWADWNRDGDWEDGSVCGCGDNEWAIQDWPVSTTTINLNLPITPCHPGDPLEPLWVRATLSEAYLTGLTAPYTYGGQPNAASSGCFWEGETEDYLVEPEPLGKCQWEKSVYINDQFAGDWDHGPFNVVISDTVTISDSVTCDFDYDWSLLEEWDPSALSLVDFDYQEGGVITDTASLEWSGGDPVKIAADTWVTLTKTLHVSGPFTATTEISETLQSSGEGGVDPIQRSVLLQELVEGGDAPSNHNHGMLPMTAYPAGGPPGAPANFPVVWDFDGSLGPGLGGGAYSGGYWGFCHSQSASPSFLGSPPTYELDADLPPDQDPATNILPPSDTPDQDGADDGIIFPPVLPSCGTALLHIVGQNNSGGALYLNAWADWSRDGDWEDGSLCGCGDHEWMIQDYLIPYNPGVPFVLDLPVTPCNPGGDHTQPVWVRVTLSEQHLATLGAPFTHGASPLPASNPPPLGCFLEGETEDYYVQPEEPECDWDKEVDINDADAGGWDDGPFGLVMSDTITIHDQLRCNFYYDWALSEEWDPDVLSLVDYGSYPGPVITDTGQLTWEGGDPDKVSPGSTVWLTKTLHVDSDSWAHTTITETVTLSPEGVLPAMQQPIQLGQLIEGGDAPSSHNHTFDTMSTHATGVQANFPVVWDWDGALGAGPVTGYYGFCHYWPSNSYLGTPPTFELDADLLPDQDMVTNIDPPTDTPDRDGSDDGVTLATPLPNCVTATLSIVGQNAYTGTLYLNAWADWNRDGDWEDTSLCACGVDEWTIRDHAIATSGNFDLSIPVTPCHTVDPSEPLWVRVTLSEPPRLQDRSEPEWANAGQPWPAPEGCFRQGETEDYLFSQYVSYTPLVTKRY